MPEEKDNGDHRGSAETYERGFLNGATGYFDGRKLDSAVMIRFLEEQGGQLVLKSGGGITFCRSDYRVNINSRNKSICKALIETTVSRTGKSR